MDESDTDLLSSMIYGEIGEMEDKEDQELIDNYLIEHCWDCWILEAEYIESNDFVLLVYRHLELSPYIPNSNYISDPPTSGTFFEDPWDRTIGYKDSYF